MANSGFKWETPHYLGLGLIFFAIGLPYLLWALGVDAIPLSDELLGKCPRRARSRGLPCNLEPYANSTLIGVGAFFSSFGLSMLVMAISSRLEELARFIGVLGHVGLAWGALGYFVRPAPTGREFGLFAAFAGVYAVLYFALYIRWLWKPWGRRNPNQI